MEADEAVHCLVKAALYQYLDKVWIENNQFFILSSIVVEQDISI